MATSVLAIIFIILLFFACSLQRVAYHESAAELKRRARRGDIGAEQLYKLVAHGENLRLMLWTLIVISAALAFVFVGEILSFWPALILLLFLVWTCFAWLPNSRVSRLELAVIGWTAPALAWGLETFHKPLTALTNLLNRFRAASFHTGLYTTDDLLDLLAAQKRQPGSRINPNALEMAMHALEFSDKRVEDAMTPRRMIKTVSTHDEVTPKLVDELHKSGQTLFAVYEDRADNIVGVLKLDDVIDLQKSGRVSTYISRKVCYVHEDFELGRVLAAFHKTHQHLLVVVNKFEDFVGVITLADVIAEMVGEPIASDFDSYHDKKVVAEWQAAAEHVAREATGKEAEQEEEFTAEVIE